MPVFVTDSREGRRLPLAAEYRGERMAAIRQPPSAPHCLGRRPAREILEEFFMRVLPRPAKLS
jgi:hypothetical protein